MKLQCQFFVALKVFILFSYPRHGVTSTEISKTCNLYGFDQCLINGRDIIEEVHDTSPEQCQFFCSNIYKDSCSFFILKEDSYDCLLFNVTLDSFLTSCKVVGGPTYPSVQECIETQDPCKVTILRT